MAQTERLSARERTLRILFSLALTVIRPRKDIIVVAGWPDAEGNAAAMLSHICTDPTYTVVRLLSGHTSPAKIGTERHLKKDSLAGAWAYVRAKYVLYTHGVFGSPRSRRGRIFVNLWHGDGPKNTENARYTRRPRANFVVAGTELWGKYKAEYFGVPQESVICFGNPRLDILKSPASVGNLEAIGVRGRFALWMPTYRAVNEAHNTWCDSSKLSEQGSLGTISRIARDLESKGYQLVVRPHPADADDYRRADLLVVDDSALSAAGVHLYQVIGAADSLVSDYSSAWVDFLTLDRPIALFCPDLDDYVSSRGLNVPSLATIAPGPICESPAELMKFLHEVAQGIDTSRERRARSARAIGLAKYEDVARLTWEAICSKATTDLSSVS